MRIMQAVRLGHTLVPAAAHLAGVSRSKNYFLIHTHCTRGYSLTLRHAVVLSECCPAAPCYIMHRCGGLVVEVREGAVGESEWDGCEHRLVAERCNGGA